MSLSPTPLPRWAFFSLALLSAVLGISASYVTGQFFIIGLKHLEPDSTAHDAIVASGILMIAVELVAFGVASLLGKDSPALRFKLIALGSVLVAFEGFTIFATQSALIGHESFQSLSTTSRINSLETSIQKQRETAELLKESGEQDIQSRHPWVRAAGVKSLKDSRDILLDSESSSKELSLLQSSQRVGLSSTLGPVGATWYAFVRSVLMSCTGLMMFAAAGSLLRSSIKQHSSIARSDMTPANDVCDICNDLINAISHDERPEVMQHQNFVASSFPVPKVETKHPPGESVRSEDTSGNFLSRAKANEGKRARTWARKTRQVSTA